MRSLRGFTLIELSIVLVIVALLVAGVLVGRELVEVSRLRAQMNQIQQYQTAVNAFRLKYGYLPGDTLASRAVSFGFVTRTGARSRGDGNGVYESTAYGWNRGTTAAAYEIALAWRDLSEAGMISENFSQTIDGINTNPNLLAGPNFYAALPKAKLRDNYAGMWGGGTDAAGEPNGKNYIFLATIYWINSGYTYTRPGLYAVEAKAIDDKLDDGMPQTGKITAMAPYHQYGVWVSAWNYGDWGGGAAPGVATAASAYTCYDNGNVAADPMRYTTSLGGDILKCSLSFELQ